jgi:hypothetical protein
LPSHEQTAPERLVDGLNLELRGDHSFGDNVNEGAEWRGNAHAVDRLDVSLAEPRMVQAEYARNGGHPPEPGRHRHVQLRRHHVGKIVQRQRSRVAEYALRLALPVP